MHVHDLTISSKAGLEHDEFVALLEALENLEVLSIHVPSPRSGVLPFISTLTDDATFGERLLSAIANMDKLRVLFFDVSYGGLHSWSPSVGSQPSGAVLGHGLRRLHSFHGDMFPAPRMHRLWAAITAAKAQVGAAPLTHFGTSMARNGFQPLARFLEVSGGQLQTLHLDLRVAASWREHNTVEAFHSSGLSVSACRLLRKLTVDLYAPSRSWICSNIPVFAAFLLTTTRCTMLEHIEISLDNLTTEAFAVPGVPEALAALDARMAEMPQLRRVDWLLAPSAGRGLFPGDVNSVESLSRILKQYLLTIVERKEVEVTCFAFRRWPKPRKRIGVDNPISISRHRE
ncbi:hypothetical protein PsYK624_122790 [Phanerochaete sordida]|uniref:Uncharacterized protein n=1 Tax=Phanerochaete sordida TaxID=48140 RepID=A0A9P3LI13_9APHY|nr:hypothetical protein PsYK624_122790 [Phanerochaete sordida]